MELAALAVTIGLIIVGYLVIQSEIELRKGKQ